MSTYTLPRMELDLSSATDANRTLKGVSESQLQAWVSGLHKKFQSKEIGFFDWPQTLGSADLKMIQDLAARLKQNFNAAIICGIGGSHLGAAALLEALRKESEELKFPIFWLNNIDPWAMERAEAFARKYKAATILISKSGNTTETLAGFFRISKRVDKSGIVAITDPESGELRRLAKENSWTTLPVPSNIGGRFSVLTAVGLLPAALGSLDLTALIGGAREMALYLKALVPLDNPGLIYAFTKFHLDQSQHHIHYLMPYHSNLKLLGDWYVQLWAESLGKKNARGVSVGPTYVAALGTRDQHSLLQLFKEGPNDKLIGFVDVVPKTASQPVGEPAFPSPQFSYLTKHTFAEINTKALNATQKSLTAAGVPTYRINFESLDESTLGAFLLFQEYACALAGELYEVDAFRQPGVEEAKKLLRDSL